MNSRTYSVADLKYLRWIADGARPLVLPPKRLRDYGTVQRTDDGAWVLTDEGRQVLKRWAWINKDTP